MCVCIYMCVCFCNNKSSKRSDISVKFNFICLFGTYSITSVGSVHKSKTIVNDNVYVSK